MWFTSLGDMLFRRDEWGEEGLANSNPPMESTV